MSYQTLETKKEEFRKYLSDSGTIETLTKVLVQLYESPDKPTNSVEFIKRQLSMNGEIDVEKLQKDYEALKMEKERVEAKVEELQTELETLKQNQES